MCVYLYIYRGRRDHGYTYDMPIAGGRERGWREAGRVRGYSYDLVLLDDGFSLSVHIYMYIPMLVLSLSLNRYTYIDT